MSRQLDALIAEHLFGWTWVTDDPNIPAPYLLEPTSDSSLRRTYYPTLWNEQTPVNPEWHMPAYSSDWRGMQLVITRLRERGYVITMKLDQTGWSVLAYHRTIIDGLTYDEGDVVRVGPELPELVARAALAALGVPLPQETTP